MKKYEIWTADREAGNLIEKVVSVEAGLALIAEYEAHDKEEGIYQPNFYAVVRGDTREELA